MPDGAPSSLLEYLPLVLQILLLAGSGLIGLKLFRTGLYKKYPVFFVYFLFRVPNSLPSLFLDNSSTLYFYIFFYTYPLVLIFYVLLVHELYRLVLEDYRGLRTAGRFAMYASLIGAIVISVLTLLPNIQPSMPQISKGLRYLSGVDRGVNTALALFIILLLGLLSRYPIQLRRNVRVQAVFYSIFFLSSTAVSLARSVLGLPFLERLNLLYSVIGVCSIFAWLFMLSPAGEAVPKRRTGEGAEHEERLLLQLEGLNAALLRVSRSKIG